MKKALSVFSSILMILSIAACGQTNGENPDASPPPPDSAPPDGQESINWDYYNERAESFVRAMADGDFDSAAGMFDAVMKNSFSKEALERDVWNIIIAHAGAFVKIHGIENQFYEGYYICFTTSEHENTGATLRIVFSENGEVSGLFLDGYNEISAESAEPVQREGYTEYPVVIGEGTDFPLNGILSIPDNVSGKAPAVVLVHGSGPNDMDETIFANKPFRDIANYLAANGIAVLRYNKRTYSHAAALAETYGGGLTVYEETVEDAVLASEMLKSHEKIDSGKVFILGHSLGGMLAPRIHAGGGNFAGIISLAGSPRSLMDITYDQQMAYLAEMPDSEEKTIALEQMETYDAQVEALMNLSDEDAKKTPVSGGVYVYYYKEMDAHPVSNYLDHIRIPFLIMQGSKDFQVTAEKDYTQWQELLTDHTAEFKLYDGLNHLFMPSAGNSIAEYQAEYQVESTVDAQVLQDIADWIHRNS